MSATDAHRPDTRSEAGPSITPREQEALDFLARWGESFDACCRSFEDLLAEDCVWDQRPIPRLTGPRSAVRFLKLARSTIGLETIDVEIRRIASDRDVVYVERVDRLRRADGSLIASAPVVGLMTFSADRVVHWREYFDSAEFVAQVLATSIFYLARRLVALPARAVRRDQPTAPDGAFQSLIGNR
jgi:limonene-1,2-epoxide hydrolase